MMGRRGPFWQAVGIPPASGFTDARAELGGLSIA